MKKIHVSDVITADFCKIIWMKAPELKTEIWFESRSFKRAFARILYNISALFYWVHISCLISGNK